MTGEKTAKESSTVVTALKLLDWFNEGRLELGLSDFARLSGLPKANILRHLAALESCGILIKDDQKKYRLGYKTLELAYIARKKLRVRDLLLPYMKKLGELTGETVTLQVEDKNRGICIERFDSNSTLVYLPPIGSMEYLHAGASRKALLAFLPPEQIEEVIAEGLPAVTADTVTDPAVLRREMAEIREKGFAISEGQHVDGIVAVSAPIKMEGGAVVASLSVVGPAFRIQEDNKQTYLGYLLAVTSEVSKQLGYKVDQPY